MEGESGMSSTIFVYWPVSWGAAARDTWRLSKGELWGNLVGKAFLCFGQWLGGGGQAPLQKH